MKRFLFSFLLCSSLAAQAQDQSPVRVYWQGQRIVVADSAATKITSYSESRVDVSVTGSSIVVLIDGLPINRVIATKFLNESGVAYSSSVKTAFANFQTAAGGGSYTQQQLNTILQGYYQRVTVANKAAAIAQATGLQPKIITVSIDESDSNRANNRYIYDGDNKPLGLPLF